MTTETTAATPHLKLGERFAVYRTIINTANLPEGMTRPPDALAKWLVITRAAVFSMTATSGLIGGLLAIGAARLTGEVSVDWGLLALAVIGLVVAHAANNMINDFFDLSGGVDTEDYVRAQYAPHPILSGWVSKRQLGIAILVANGIDLAIMLFLASIRGPLVIAFALAGLFISVFYVAASCNVPRIAPDSYIAIGPERLRISGPTGANAFTTPRPSIVVAHMAGNMRDISKSLAALLEGAYKPPADQGQSARTSAEPDPRWREWLSTAAWSSRGSFEGGMRAIGATGWGSLHEEGEWSLGTGVAVSWAPAWSYVSVKGRSLAQLGNELTAERRFTDDQVRAIIGNNAELRRSLEGELVQRGWLPIGALLDAPQIAVDRDTGQWSFAPRPRPLAEAVRQPQGFDTLQALQREAQGAARAKNEPFLQILRECRRDEQTTPDLRMTTILRRGLSTFGGLENSLAHSLGGSTSVKITGDEVRVVSCEPMSAASPAFGTIGPRHGAQLMVVDFARVSADRFGVRTLLKQSIVDNGSGRIFSAHNDWHWPIAIDGQVVIGIRPRGESRKGWDDVPLRAWLDRAIASHPVVEKLQMPVAKLRLALPAHTVDRSALKPNSGVLVLTLESAAAAARTELRVVQCPASPAASLLRDQAEKQVGLQTIAADRRALQRTAVLVAENAVEAFAPTFERAPEGSIWQVPSATGIVPMERDSGQDPRARTTKQLEHGTFVAALLGATGPIKGLLGGTELVWVDLQKSPSEHFEGMQMVRGLGAVMNLSQALDARWWEDFRTSIAQSTDWQTHVLVVAAAKNVGDLQGDGEPLKSSHLNVMGVGVVDAQGNPPTQVTYEMSHVDVLAPGLSIPSINHKGEIVCGDGTSFAVPYVSAVAALLAERQDAVQAPLVRARLIATSNWKSTYARQVKGGVLDAVRALSDTTEDMFEMLIDEQSGTTQKYKTTLDNRNGKFFVEGVLATSRIPAPDRETHEGQWFKVLRMTRFGSFSGRPAYRIVYVDDRGQLKIVEQAVLRDPNKPLRFSECALLPTTAEAAPCGTLIPGKIVDFVARYRPGLEIKSFGSNQ